MIGSSFEEDEPAPRADVTEAARPEEASISIDRRALVAPMRGEPA